MKTVKNRPVITTAKEVVELLRLKYPANAYAFLEQVGDSTGFACSRHCDVLIMGLWPSRGLEIRGIEVKVRRSDWLKELQTPEKAEAIAQYCDRWYVAVGDANIVQEGELPATWGLLVPKADGTMYCKTEAKLKEPEPTLDRSFIAAVLRQIQIQLTEQAKLEAEYKRGYHAGIEEEKGRNWYKTDLEELQKTIAAFEKASGVSLKHTWVHKPEQIGDAVRRVLNGYDSRVKKQLEGLHKQALDIAHGIEVELKKDICGNAHSAV